MGRRRLGLAPIGLERETNVIKDLATIKAETANP